MLTAGGARLAGGAAGGTIKAAASLTGRIGAAYEAVQTWLVRNGYVGGGEPWECYLDGPDAPQPRTEVFFPCHQLRPVHA